MPVQAGADLLITNVTLWSGARPRPTWGWLAIQGGRVHSTGGRDDTPPGSLQRIDGQGKVVLPSFVDCHSHISAGSIASICRNGSHFRSRHDALAAVSAAAAQDASDWLVLFYVDWDAWDDPRPPTAAELEDASGGRKVILVCESLHRAILSDSGLRACQISQLAHSRFVETRKGEMTGVVWEEVFSVCLEQVLHAVIAALGEDGFAHVLQAEARRHLACGITDAHDPCVTHAMSQAMQGLNRQTPLRISWSEVGAKGPLSSADGGQALQDFGEGPSSAKVFTDGAHRCAMCIEATDALRMSLGMLTSAITRFNFRPLRQLLSQPTAYRQGRFYQQGALFKPADLSARLRALDDTHARIKIHALGNHAVDMSCDCILESGITSKVCLEHATIVDNRNIDKLARLGVQVSAQPGFLPHFGSQFTNMRLTGRYRGLALRSMLDAGVDLIMSSDYPCGPLDPLHNMRCAVNRALPGGGSYLESEAVSPEEAVYAYTIAGMKGICGSPKPGLIAQAPADFVILTADPFVDASRVDSTWMAGKCVHQS